MIDHHYPVMLDPDLQSELKASVGKGSRIREGGKPADFVRRNVGEKLRFDGKHDETLLSQRRRG